MNRRRTDNKRGCFAPPLARPPASPNRAKRLIGVLWALAGHIMCRAYVVMFITLQSIGLCLNTRTVGTATIYDIKMLCPPAAEVFTPPAVGSAEYCNQHVCVCVCVCLSVRGHSSGTARPIFTKVYVRVTYGHVSVLVWRRSDTLRISGFVDDVIFAHKLIGCSTSPPGWGSEAHTYAGLSLARRNTRSRQRTLGTTSCSQSLLGRSGRVECLWNRACFR